MNTFFLVDKWGRKQILETYSDLTPKEIKDLMIVYLEGVASEDEAALWYDNGIQSRKVDYYNL